MSDVKMGDAVRMAVEILTPAERRQALVVMLPVVISALSSAMMIGSIMPFLTVLSDPNRLHDGGYIANIYKWSGVTSDYRFLAYLGVASVAIILFSSLANILRIYAIWNLSAMLIHTLSCRLLAIFLRQPYEFFLKSHSGDMATSVLSECEQLAMQVYKPAADLFASLLTALAIMIMVVWVNPVIALSTITFLGIVYSITFNLSRRLVQRLGKIRVQANTERYRIAGEALNGIKDVKILGREIGYLTRFEAPSERIAIGRIKANIIAEMPKYIVEASSLCGIIILCLIIVESNTFGADMGSGDIIPLLGIFAFAAQRLIPELQRSYAALNKLQYGSAAIQKVYQDLHLDAELPKLVRDTPRPLPLTEKICAESIVHRYEGANRDSLSCLDFCIWKGERIGLVGGSGSGKTTLADVLLGLLQLESGVLLVDGTPLTEDNIRSWQQTVGYVPQNIFLTNGTVAENIALGIESSQIDMEKVRKSAEVASLIHVIENELPFGFDTKLGERGMRLSGGQRQRIGIARALYHDADLIIFDEATSALDNVTEAEVVESINRLPGDKTVLIIAHRLSTVRDCDRLMVMEKGEIVGFDKWESLAENNPTFRALLSRSTGIENEISS